MACVEKIKCKDCGGSNLQVFYNETTDSYSSFCFSGCNEYKGNPYKKGHIPVFKVKTQEEIREEISDTQRSPIFQGLGQSRTFRGIPGAAFKSWGVRLLVSEEDGVKPYAVAFPYSDEGKLVGWKVSTLKKKAFWSVGSTKNADSFGLERALKIGGKTLYITEGEFDAIALDYALVKDSQRGDSKYTRKSFPVISLSAGAGSMAKNLKKIRKRIKNNFDEVVLVVDNDKHGLKAEKKAQELFPDILRADKPSGCKDANEAVEKQLTYKLANLVRWKAHKPPIEGVVLVSTVLSKALEKPVMGLSYPIEGLSKLTYGQRFGEAVALGAGVGTGKTVTAHEFAAWNMTEHGVPCYMILLEEENHFTVKNVAAKIDDIPYSNPTIQYDEDQFIETVEGLQDKLIMWESSGDQYLRFDMEEIMSSIRFNVEEYGTRFVYLDNFTRLVDHLSPSDANEFINRYSSEVENLASQLDINIMCYSHLNPPFKGSTSHEAGGEVFLSQFTGSRGIMRSFPMIMSFRRNKHATSEDGQSKDNSIITVLKNRKYGNEDEVRTQYQPTTGRLLEYDWEGDLESPDKKKRR